MPARLSSEVSAMRYPTGQGRDPTGGWLGADVVSHGGDLDVGAAVGALDGGQDARQVHAGHHGEYVSFWAQSIS